LIITDGAANSPQNVMLDGDGEDFVLTIPSGSHTSVTVPAGGTANYTINVGDVDIITPMSARFTCSGAPAESFCSISPNPFQVGSVGVITVSVATASATQGAPRSSPRNIPPPPARGIKELLFLAIALTSGIWAFMLGRRKGLRRWGLPLLPLAAGLALLFTLSGCGGSGGAGVGGGAHDPGTPTGTYTITITGTAVSSTSTVSRAVTLTLKVT
jgi:hypothetical protein